MTTAEMLTVLGDRLEDTSGDLFSDTVKLRYLNIAQDKLIQLLNPHLLTDLQVIKKNITLSTDNDVDTHFKRFFAPDNSTLDSTPFGGVLGVLGIRVVDSNFIRKISFDMAKDFTTGYYAFSATEPVYFAFKNRIYIYNVSANVDCYFIKEPTALATSPTANSDLNAIFHDALVELAEAELWRLSNNQARKQDAEQRAYGMIGKYNQNPATQVVGEGLPFDHSSSNSLVDPIYPNNNL
mgnify:CR=1 FL=1|tara:strand:- start:2564 stop:3277 length:714 start_codon:yes stop_codon:yes gene_type:complete